MNLTMSDDGRRSYSVIYCSFSKFIHDILALTFCTCCFSLRCRFQIHGTLTTCVFWQVDRYKHGKTKLMHFFVRLVQDELDGRAHFKTVTEVLEQLLSTDDWQFWGGSANMSGLASCEAALSHRLWLHAVSHFGFVKQPTLLHVGWKIYLWACRLIILTHLIWLCWGWTMARPGTDEDISHSIVLNIIDQPQVLKFCNFTKLI